MLLEPSASQSESESEVVAGLRRMVLHPDYPCLGARSVFRRRRATIVLLDELGTRQTAVQLLSQLRTFSAAVDPDAGFASFVAAFRQPVRVTEPEFERLLWQQLQHLNAVDPHPWNQTVAADPVSPHFSFSAAGTAYFVVGMHPGASRIARQAPLPTLVFNLHVQFERLRESAQFSRLQQAIRRRDRALQGDINPMVTDYGMASEARQYAGRSVPADWSPPVEPPFQQKAG